MEYSRYIMEFLRHSMGYSQNNMEYLLNKMVNSRSVSMLFFDDGIFSAKNGKITVYYGNFTVSCPQFKMEYSPSDFLKMVNSLCGLLFLILFSSKI